LSIQSTNKDQPTASADAWEPGVSAGRRADCRSAIGAAPHRTGLFGLAKFGKDWDVSTQTTRSDPLQLRHAFDRTRRGEDGSLENDVDTITGRGALAHMRIGRC